MKAESAFPIDNPDNDLKILNLKRTLEDLDKAMQIIQNHKDDPDDDATEKMATWTNQRRHDWRAQRKEDEASQAPKNVVSHDVEGHYLLGDPCDDPESSKNQGQE
jgi:hypothetical protein